MAKRKKQPAAGAIQPRQSFSRLQSGIPGLDSLLCGGFLSGGTYLILGTPGTGKTILANQLSFHEASDKRRALYVTLLAENHTRMFGHLETLSFFDRSQVSEKIQYVSGYSVLEKDGLEGLLKLLGALVQRHHSTVLFIDGIASADELASSPVAFKKFVHNLNTVLGISGCTTFLISSVKGDGSRPEYTMVDGIVSLTLQNVGMRSAREIEVSKFRGSPHLYGRHFFEISSDGVNVYPRIETKVGIDRVPVSEITKRSPTGIESLDRLLDGGVVKGSITSLIGPAGTAKTIIGMSFLEEGAKNGEQGLFLNLYEHPVRIEAKMKLLGSRIGAYFKSGKVKVIRRLPSEYLLDKLIYQLVAKVVATNTKRLFIDGLAGLKEKGMLGSERLPEIMKALVSELRALGVTTMFVEETDSEIQDPCVSFDSAVTDNIIELSHASMENVRVVTLNVLKTRESGSDPTMYELLFTDRGVKIGKSVKFIKPDFPLVEPKGRSRA